MNFYTIAGGLFISFLFGYALGFLFGLDGLMKLQFRILSLEDMAGSANRRLAALLSIVAKDDADLLRALGFWEGPGHETLREQLLGKEKE